MKRTPKFPSIFLFMFAVPFLGAGLMVTFAGLAGSGQGTGKAPAWFALLGVPFVLLGIGCIYLAFYGRKKLNQQASREEQAPGSPWLWREDWAVGRAVSDNQNRAISLWIITVLANCLILPIAIVALPPMQGLFNGRSLILIGFCILSLGLLVAAVRATIRRKRFGKTYFEFASAPFSPGGTLSGRIHLHLPTTAEHGIDLRLRCVRRIVTHSGKNSNTTEVPLWEDEHNVGAASISSGPLGSAIPVSFQIPANAASTDHEVANDQILWRLHAKADVPGVDYSDDFEVPVFHSRTTQPRKQPLREGLSGFADAFIATAASLTPETDASEVSAPAKPQVVISTTGEGTQFYFSAARNFGKAVGTFFFAAIWTMAVYFMAGRAPLFFTVIFGLANLLLICLFLTLAFGSWRIVVGNGRVRIRRSFLGIGRWREIESSDIASVLPVVSAQGGTQSNYSIRLRTQTGRKITLADLIPTRQEARWVVSQIEQLAGLKLDTHVEVDLPYAAARRDRGIQ